MKTYSAKPADVKRTWYVIDASENSFGRVASFAAKLLNGKHKPTYTPHVDTGDFVIIINSDKLQVTGDKLKKKVYFRHSSYPGGITETTLSELLKKDSTLAVKHAVRGMLPDNKLRDGRLKRLKVYTDSNHNHSAQKPVTVSAKDIS